MPPRKKPVPATTPEGERVTATEDGAENVPPLMQGTPPEVDPIQGDDPRTTDDPRSAEEVGGHPDAGNSATGAPVVEVPQEVAPNDAEDSEEETMRVRVLVEQHAVTTPDGGRRYLPSGQETDLPQSWAKELLSRGEAEPVAVKPEDDAEKRPSQAQRDSR